MFARWECEATPGREAAFTGRHETEEMDRTVVCIAPGIDRALDPSIV